MRRQLTHTFEAVAGVEVDSFAWIELTLQIMKPTENLATANDEAQRTTETKLTESLESRLKDRFYGARDGSASFQRQPL
jgi:hypothetical protein